MRRNRIPFQASKLYHQMRVPRDSDKGDLWVQRLQGASHAHHPRPLLPLPLLITMLRLRSMRNAIHTHTSLRSRRRVSKLPACTPRTYPTAPTSTFPSKWASDEDLSYVSSFLPTLGTLLLIRAIQWPGSTTCIPALIRTRNMKAMACKCVPIYSNN